MPNPKSQTAAPAPQFVTRKSPLATRHPSPLAILGVPIHDVTYAETLALIEEFIAAGRPHQICTANPEFVMAAQSDDEFRFILNRADLVLPDGIGLIWASTWLAATRNSQSAFRERVAGSTLTWKACELAARRGWRVYFLGAAEGVAARAAEILREKYPSLNVAGTFAGSPRVEDEDEIVERVRAAAPQILLVAYGAPQQDKWIARNSARLGVPVMMGVGGALDFIAGVAARAPDWMQKLGLEWFHRLLHQPWRWRRMMALPKFAVKILLD
ncbi:MAG: WecB/TagA/CpsF family glycosyltransferase [Chloroflexi bacterium]|nr:WecB/TagA/CpsF family glycosyltransferase [Chloroflexota bacterium]